MKLEIIKGVPVPPGRIAVTGLRFEVRQALTEMEPGDSFVWKDNHTPYLAAKEMGLRIKTRKLNGGGYQVWKVK